jgi:hypothetical protein
VSLAPEGYRLYPIYVDQAWETFQELAAFARGKGRTFRGKPMSVPKRGHAKSEHIQRSLNEYLRQTAPAYTAPDEGPAVSDDDYTALEAAFKAMTSDRKLVLASWVTEGKKAGRHWKITEGHTVRRFECYRAAMALLEVWDGNADYCRACLAVVLGDLQGTDTIGGLIGTLTTEQAVALERITRASGEGHAAAFTDAGVLHWADPDALRALVDA